MEQVGEGYTPLVQAGLGVSRVGAGRPGPCHTHRCRFPRRRRLPAIRRSAGQSDGSPPTAAASRTTAAARHETPWSPRRTPADNRRQTRTVPRLPMPNGPCQPGRWADHRPGRCRTRANGAALAGESFACPGPLQVVAEVLAEREGRQVGFGVHFGFFVTGGVAPEGGGMVHQPPAPRCSRP